MRKILLKSITVFCFLFSFSLPLSAYEIDISADNLEYDQNCGKISAKGNVVLVWEGKHISSDYAEFLTSEKIMNAYGNVKVEEAGNAVYAKKISYSYDEEKGEIQETFAYSSMIFMRSQTMERQNKDSYAINNIKIALCDLDEPHTYFKAKRGKIILGERITLYNPILYVGKIPIFYLPIITKSLKGGKGISARLSYNFEPGYTSEGGFSLKNMIGYQFSDSFAAKSMIDYYGKKGVGYGLELNYNKKDLSASIYAYNIDDLYAGSQRWTVRPYYNQRINKQWSIRSQAEFISDSSFNYYYNQNGLNATNNTLNSYISITRQGSDGNLTVLAQRYDKLNQVTGEFDISSMLLPQINYTYYPKKIFGGITNGFSFSYNNEYKEYIASSGNLFYKNTANLTYNLTKDFRFGRRFTLKPSLSLIEEWHDKDNFGFDENMFNTKYQTGLNSRLRVNRWMDWNINYSATFRAAQNSLLVDNKANDYGIERNFVSFTNYMYVGERTTVRNFLSYNFANSRVSPLKSSDRLSPLSTEIIYTPKYYVTVYLKQGQQLDPLRFQSAQLDIKIGEIQKAYFNFGAFYQYYPDTLKNDSTGLYYDNPSAYRSKQIDNTLGFGLWITPKWRIDYSARLTSRIDKVYTRLNDHEFKIYRDLHCYNLGFTWRLRGIYHEVFFKFNIKTNMPFDRNNLGKENEEDSVFYPWS